MFSEYIGFRPPVKVHDTRNKYALREIKGPKAVIMNTVPWDAKPCDLVASYLGFAGNCYLRLQGKLIK
jgi:hypothetical protein